MHPTPDRGAVFTRPRRATAAIWLLAAWAALAFVTRASAQTDDPCAYTNLIAQLAAGEPIIFDQDCTVVLSNEFVLTGEVEIDAAGNTVIFQAGNSNRLFVVESNAVVQITGLTFSEGSSAQGGAFKVLEGGTLYLTACTFMGNLARGETGEAGSAGRDSEGEAGNGTAGAAGLPAYGGAIYNQGLVVIEDSVFATNQVVGGAGGAGGAGGNGGWQGGNGSSGGHGAHAYGGAIYNLGTLAVSNTLFDANAALGGDGGAGGEGGDGDNRGNGGKGGSGRTGYGGGIYSLGNLLVTNCTFDSQWVSGGAAGEGGLPGDGHFIGTTGSGGAAGAAFGSAIYTAGESLLVGTTFSYNEAEGAAGGNGGTLGTGDGMDGLKGGDAAGGAVFNAGEFATVVNSTFYLNRASGGAGGNGADGLAFGGKGADGGIGAGGGLYSSNSIYVLNCTLVGCAAVGGTNGVGGSPRIAADDGKKGASLGGNVRNFGTYFGLQNSILAGHTNGGNGTGVFVDEGYNISSDATISLGTTSRKSTNPKLGSFGDYGGPTYTMMPLAGSPAINTGDPVAAPETDQRDFERFGQGNPQPDIGAVEGQPATIVMPSTRYVAQGTTASVIPVVSGDSPFYYQWRFYGTNLPSFTSSVLVRPNAQEAYEGPYHLVVSNIFGVVTSSVVHIVVGTGVSITTQPQSATVTQGNSALFSVSASGESPLAYQWRFQGTNIANATASTLLIPNATTPQAGLYSVVITNLYSSATSSNALLKVTPPTSLAPLGVVSTNFALAFGAQTGITYVLQYKNALQDTTWTSLRTNGPLLSGTITNLDPLPNNATSRFYRLLVY